MKKTLSIIVIAIVVSVAVFAILRMVRLEKVSEVAVENKKKVFKPAPDFTLSDIYGAKKSLSDFKGKVIILDFWATWCPPCKAEIPHFIELYKEYRNQGLEIIGVALDWNAQRVVAPFVQERGINYTVLLGKKDVTDLYGGIMSIPTTFIIDRNGGIRKRYIGYKDKEIFEKEIKKLL